MRWHGCEGARERRERALAMLRRVGIEPAERRVGQYPHQFSGGQRQRIMIAMALMCNPDLLIADEPTTALDVTVQAQILELMKELQGHFGTSIILITHDLGVIASKKGQIPKNLERIKLLTKIPAINMVKIRIIIQPPSR